jgi:hypothetical protein
MMADQMMRINTLAPAAGVKLAAAPAPAEQSTASNACS